MATRRNKTTTNRQLEINTSVIEPLERHPEFKQAVDDIVQQTIMSIHNMSKKIDSTMPYKQQFMLEEITKRLQNWI